MDGILALINCSYFRRLDSSKTQDEWLNTREGKLKYIIHPISHKSAYIESLPVQNWWNWSSLTTNGPKHAFKPESEVDECQAWWWNWHRQPHLTRKVDSTTSLVGGQAASLWGQLARGCIAPIKQGPWRLRRLQWRQARTCGASALINKPGRVSRACWCVPTPYDMFNRKSHWKT